MDTLIPKRWQPLVIGALLIGIAALVFVNVDVPEDENGGVGGMLVGVALLLLATFLLWRFVVGPRLGAAETAGTAALVLGIVSLLTGLAFWSGLPFAFAPAAVALGTAASPDPKGKAAVILGWLGFLLAVVLLILDQAT